MKNDTRFMLLPLALIALVGCSTPGLQPREGYANVPGGRVWFKVVGSGSGTPLLLLHGGPGGTSRTFEPLCALTNERPLIFYDQLGGGRSERPSDTNLWRVERFVEELKCVRRELGLRRFHLLGHSWGSLLAVEYMNTRPQGVESLILSGGAFSMARCFRDINGLVTELPPDVRATLVGHMTNQTTQTAEYQQAAGVFMQRHFVRAQAMPPELADFDLMKDFGVEVAQTMIGMDSLQPAGVLKDYDATAHLRELRLPVLFTAGQYDYSTPAANAWYQSLVPGAHLEIIPNSGHMIMLDNPKHYAEVVRAFLREAEGKR
jgi:proline iminopeptidase